MAALLEAGNRINNRDQSYLQKIFHTEAYFSVTIAGKIGHETLRNSY
jgi:hypothetical protein